MAAPGAVRGGCGTRPLDAGSLPPPPPDPSNASLSHGNFYFCLLPSINCIPVFRSTPCLNIRSLAS